MALTFITLGTDVQRTLVSGDADIDKWYRNKALKEHQERLRLVTCAHHVEHEAPIGYYALAAVAENARKLPGVKFSVFETDLYFPCLQLVYLAVRQDLQCNGHGTEMLVEIIRQFIDIGTLTGMPALIVTPLNARAKKLYISLGFTPYPKGTGLVLSLQNAIATFEQAQSEIEAGDLS